MCPLEDQQAFLTTEQSVQLSPLKDDCTVSLYRLGQSLCLPITTLTPSFLTDPCRLQAALTLWLLSSLYALDPS